MRSSGTGNIIHRHRHERYVKHTVFFVFLNLLAFFENRDSIGQKKLHVSFLLETDWTRLTVLAPDETRFKTKPLQGWSNERMKGINAPMGFFFL